jgi:hypothetical protein
MALEEWVSGPYIANYKAPGGSAQSIGLTDQGFELQFTPQNETIESSDVYGAALLDGITRGHNASLTFTMKSYKKALVTGLIWQFTANPLYMQGGGPVAAATVPTGRLMSALAGEIVMTGQANTPAASVDNNSGAGYANNVFGINRILTASQAILAPGQSINFLMDSRLRQVTLGMALLPYSATISAATWIVFGVAS